jgi:hypothetical protein
MNVLSVQCVNIVIFVPLDVLMMMSGVLLEKIARHVPGIVVP